MSMTKAVDATCIKSFLVTGGNDGAALTCTGITASDTLIKCIEMGSTMPTTTDKQSQVTLGAGTITLTSTSGGRKLDVLWHDSSA